MKRAWSRKNLWEDLPRPVKAAAGRLLSAAPPEIVLGRQFRRMAGFVEAAESWSAQAAAAYQLRQLQRICRLAYDQTRLYRRLFDSAGFHPGDLRSAEQLTALPMIDKQTLREHLSEMLTVSPNAPGVDYVATGGSSGVPLHFYIGRERSAVEYAHLAAGWRRAGYDLRMPQVVFRGQTVAPDAAGLRHEYDPLLRRHYYSNFHMADGDIARYLEHISRIGPCFLHVYPSSAVVLARHCERTGRRPPANILGILAGSENVYAADRVLVERVFGVRMFSWYGHSEKLVLAAECEHSTDYHVWPTYGFVELVDEAGRAVRTPGQRGEIVGTGFINTATPFIRYRTGDFATYVGGRCPACGREQVLIRDVLGHRTQEMLVAADGALISWTAINMHDDTFAKVRQFQFRQDRAGEAVLRLVPAEGFTSDERQRMVRKLRQKLNGRIHLDLELVESISLTGRGKMTYVDQRIAIAGAPCADHSRPAQAAETREQELLAVHDG